MTSRSNLYPTVVPIYHTDLGDALLLGDRDGIALAEVLTEALHIGMAALLDKAEARWMGRVGTSIDNDYDLDDYATAVLLWLDVWTGGRKTPLFPIDMDSGVRVRRIA